MTPSLAPAGVAIEPLTAERFAPFGDVVPAHAASGRPVNQGRGRRSDLDRLEHAGEAAEPRLAVYDLDPSPLPVRVDLLERHPLSAQLFMALEAATFLVVVAPTRRSGDPDLAGLRAFAASPREAVVYAPGVWHMPLVSLQAPARFLMAMWETGDSRDCEEWRLADPLDVNSGLWRP
jgi:ureidoglycolate lyase